MKRHQGAKAILSRRLTLFTRSLKLCLSARLWLRRRNKTYKIATTKELAPKEKLFEVEAPDIAAKAKPGQFVIVIIGKKGERIPLTICDCDRTKGTVSFAFHEVGKTTKELGLLCEGDCLENVTGPLGNPSEIKNYGKVLCVGGSIMIAPLLLQVKAMKEAGNSVTTILGARIEDALIMASVNPARYFGVEDSMMIYPGRVGPLAIFSWEDGHLVVKKILK